MAGDARAGADDGGRQIDALIAARLVDVRVDASEGADDGALADGDSAAIIQQGALADGDAFLDGQVVAVGEVHAVIDFNARAHAGKKIAAQHGAEAQAQPVVGSDGRAVEHLPEPEQRLAHGEPLRVHVGKVLGLGRYVFRVQREADDVAGQLGGQLQIELAAVRTAQVELG